MPLDDILDVGESIGSKEELSRKIQDKYATYVRKGQLDNLRDLQGATEIKPSKDVYKIFIESIFKQ